jgi:phage terminase large subunit
MTISLLPSQRRFWHSEAKHPAFVGGIGSGKTFVGSLKAISMTSEGDGMVVAPTFPMLRDVTQRTFFELLDATNIPYSFNKAEGKLEVNGHIVLFRSADNPERLRGPNLTWFYIDEAALCREKVWDILIGRLRVGETTGWITTTPKGFDWIHNRWVEQGLAGYELVNSHTEENRHLPIDYVADLKASYTGEFARQELEGGFVAFEGLVYDFRHEAHVIKPFTPPEDWQRFRAIDYGYTNPFVCLWGTVDGDGRLYIYDEHYQSKQLLDYHAELIKARGKAAWTVADHDAQENAEMTRRGVQTMPAQKEVISGIQKVSARLAPAGDGKPRLFVTENCKNLIREFGLYQWQGSKDGRNEKEEPVKENDHALDALRYMVMQLDNSRTPRVWRL